jgi:hypothetical protein
VPRSAPWWTGSARTGLPAPRPPGPLPRPNSCRFRGRGPDRASSRARNWPSRDEPVCRWPTWPARFGRGACSCGSARSSRWGRADELFAPTQRATASKRLLCREVGGCLLETGLTGAGQTSSPRRRLAPVVGIRATAIELNKRGPEATHTSDAPPTTACQAGGNVCTASRVSPKAGSRAMAGQDRLGALAWCPAAALRGTGNWHAQRWLCGVRNRLGSACGSAQSRGDRTVAEGERATAADPPAACRADRGRPTEVHLP